MGLDIETIRDRLNHPRVRKLAIVLVAMAACAAAWRFFPHIHRKPPSIFDTPVDDVFGYLMRDDFNDLSVEERMTFLQGVMQRFKKMSQSESVVASSFFAGLTGPASEKLMDNARKLGKDVLVQGAGEFLSKKTDAERSAFIDQWIIKWIRFGEESSGDKSGKSDGQILGEISDQARQDAGRVIEVTPKMAQQIMDFWERDVASVASPKEQSQIFQFLPAIRDHMLRRSK